MLVQQELVHARTTESGTSNKHDTRAFLISARSWGIGVSRSKPIMSKSLYKELREIWGRQDVNANNPCPEALKLPVETYCYGFQLIQPCDDKVKKYQAINVIYGDNKKDGQEAILPIEATGAFTTLRQYDDGEVIAVDEFGETYHLGYIIIKK